VFAPGLLCLRLELDGANVPRRARTHRQQVANRINTRQATFADTVFL
jgi:hypothetical protein